MKLSALNTKDLNRQFVRNVGSIDPTERQKEQSRPITDDLGNESLVETSSRWDSLFFHDVSVSILPPA